ncbi:MULTISPECIES: hypothetical protein [Halobacterium]|uniref:hypothetical protein n=1 Tax=Halobacterium TaxID=2239 RepID=UPI001964434F|nr:MULTISPECIES: hypothetical protein [Halobacterium]MCF2207489.1 hypothetical protein [Halobacterium salinarum]MCF2240837.1 hypothetical protein [Halobacterium salinarum]MDL0125353.1 hypothetical protein [Halobacterium salinarum]QRY24007.1 hypothetical protein JRZ79_06200 [Halobacterium sp. BOL4-2]
MNEVTRRNSIRKFGVVASFAGLGTTFSQTASASSRKEVTIKSHSPNTADYEVTVSTDNIETNKNIEENDNISYDNESATVSGQVKGYGEDSFTIPDEESAQLTCFGKEGGSADVKVENTGNHTSEQGNVEVTGEDNGHLSDCSYSFDVTEFVAGYSKIDDQDGTSNDNTSAYGTISGGIDQWKLEGEILHMSFGRRDSVWVEINMVQ